MHCEVAIISLTYLILEENGGRESIFTAEDMEAQLGEINRCALPGGRWQREGRRAHSCGEEPSPHQPGDDGV